MTTQAQKVLHVIPSLGPLRGGPSLAVQAMARGLVGAGVDVHIATTNDNGPGLLDVPLGQPVVQDGITYWYFPRQTRLYTASWPLTRWLARHVRAYDLLHIHALFSYAPLPAAFYAARAGVPYVLRPLGILNRWGMEQRRPMLKRLSFMLIERRILAGAAAVHYTSVQEQDEAARLTIPTPPVIIPLGVELATTQHIQRGTWRSHYPAAAGRTIILFLSRLDRKKGLDLLLPAFAQLRQTRPDLILFLVGTGDAEYEAELRGLAQQLGIAADVVFTGFVTGEQKLAAMADSDLFVLPSYSENFGVAVVEAMASGLPVIVCPGVGIAPDITQAEAGLVVLANVADLHAALQQLSADPALRQRMGQRAQRLAAERFSTAAMTRSLLKLYGDILSQKQRGLVRQSGAPLP